MSIFSHIPEQFTFEYQNGKFFAKKSFWQNTLDKSSTTYVIELEGFGEYGETKILVNTDDWVADAIEAVKEHTISLAMQKFIENGDPDTSESLVEAVTELPEEEPSEFDLIVNGYVTNTSENLSNSETPFAPVEETEISDSQYEESGESLSEEHQNSAQREMSEELATEENETYGYKQI